MRDCRLSDYYIWALYVCTWLCTNTFKVVLGDVANVTYSLKRPSQQARMVRHIFLKTFCSLEKIVRWCSEREEQKTNVTNVTQFIW